MLQQLEIWGTNDPNISAQLALAIQMDLFRKDAGFAVSYRLLESGPRMPYEILAASKKPFAVLQTPITSMILNDKGYHTKIVAPLADIAGTQQMIIRPDRGITHPKDLEGKRVGMAKDAAIHVAVRNMARDYGVDLRNVEFVNLMPHEQMIGFEEGTLDALACWEPWTTKARNLGGKMFFSGARSEIPGMEGDVNWLVDEGCLIVPDEHIEHHREEVIAILRVLRKATELLNEHRREIVKKLAPFFDIAQDELITAMRKNLYSMTFDNLFRIGVLAFRDALYQDGLISKKLSEQEVYDVSLFQQIDPSAILFEETLPQDVTVIGKANIFYRQDLTLAEGGRNVRFLVADDSKVVRSSLAQTVEILGGEVVGEASTGQAAIDVFTEQRPNFVTMDLSMPGVSGIDAIEHILRLAPDTHIIVISGNDLQELRDEVFELGAEIFIVKPFDPLLVAEVIGLLLLW
ncbi:hypothetical protein CSA56_14270 [candidate division KSB3 bacterium]|uniref:Response regulatory domain-containing protein n=1 Tax=candidate division KSB3 bacterium TaxID=2044937 RepID=A0A2G6KD77_9BACT|nr:MAG: hypothetical protein CSA56_14270 [candidate division KSB3 bacterium]